MRGGSKSLRNKNLKIINGKPLLYYTINQAVKSKIFDLVMVSTDSKKIYNYSKKYGAKAWFLRPKKLSTATAPKLLAIKHALNESEKKFKTKFDIIFNLHVTSPLRTTSDIKNALKQFLKDGNNQLISVSPSSRNPYFNMIEKKGYSQQAMDLEHDVAQLIFKQEQHGFTFNKEEAEKLYKKTNHKI